ncbi:hypothetical protein SDC9_38733 [bioreactor metagenome]|uniref:Uncharacterized protein n=1 Tax=bioreactor metagenome TaxID=1076179 RepID=A0A644VN52_9ZZZZ
MDEHVLGLAPDIGEAKALALVKPLHPRRFKRQRGQRLGIGLAEILDRGRASLGLGRHDLDHLDRLRAARRRLHHHRDAGIVGDRALPEIAQHIGMQQDVGTALLIDDEAEPLARVEPFYAPRHGPGFGPQIVHHHPSITSTRHSRSGVSPPLRSTLTPRPTDSSRKSKENPTRAIHEA